MATIYYHDIGDYLTREEKLVIVKKFQSVANGMSWTELLPNEHGDWITHRNDIFSNFIPLEAEDKFNARSNSFFVAHSLGIATARDSWVYNFCKKNLANSMQRTISFYDEQRSKFRSALKVSPQLHFDTFASNDATKISWNDSLRNMCSKNLPLPFSEEKIRFSMYRPFCKNFVYFDRNFIQRPYQQPKFFPNKKSRNVVICLTGIGNLGFSLLITDILPDLCFVKTGNGGAQCFPLYIYEEAKTQTLGLFDEPVQSEYLRRDGVSDFIWERAKKQYGKNVTKEDIFYYVYGFLHSPDYCQTFAVDLKKMLPRLPLVEDVRHFWAFSKAGRKLAALHLNYETMSAHQGVQVTGAESGFFTVEKMRFPKKGEKDTIIYNSCITVSNIPLKAYDYLVNGKSAIEWTMERYAITTHKESGITNDPNDWAAEVGNPRYILDLLLSIINVSVQTVEIVATLPKLHFESAVAPDKKDQNLSEELTNTADMRPRKHTDHIYSVQDIAAYLPISEDRIRKWVRQLADINYEGVVKTGPKSQHYLINFYGMFELVVIYDLNIYFDKKENKDKQRIPISEIMGARNWLKEKFNTNYPFAHKPIVEQITKGGRLIVWTNPNNRHDIRELGKSFGAQLLFPYINAMLERIAYADDFVDHLYTSKSKNFIIDPRIQSGRPSSVKTHVSMEAIKSVYQGCYRECMSNEDEQKRLYALEKTLEAYEGESEATIIEAISGQYEFMN